MKTSTVYLNHYIDPLYHSQHYMGSTIDLRRRLNEHWQGKANCKISQAFYKKGIPFLLARTWIGDRKLERKLKDRHNHRKLCPICKEE